MHRGAGFGKGALFGGCLTSGQSEGSRVSRPARPPPELPHSFTDGMPRAACLDRLLLDARAFAGAVCSRTVNTPGRTVRRPGSGSGDRPGQGRQAPSMKRGRWPFHGQPGRSHRRRRHEGVRRLRRQASSRSSGRRLTLLPPALERRRAWSHGGRALRLPAWRLLSGQERRRRRESRQSWPSGERPYGGGFPS